MVSRYESSQAGKKGIGGNSSMENQTKEVVR